MVFHESINSEITWKCMCNVHAFRLVYKHFNGVIFFLNIEWFTSDELLNSVFITFQRKFGLNKTSNFTSKFISFFFFSNWRNILEFITMQFGFHLQWSSMFTKSVLRKCRYWKKSTTNSIYHKSSADRGLQIFRVEQSMRWKLWWILL